MDAPDLSDMEAAVLQAVHAEGNADLYALAQAVGTGPRTVQDAVRRLATHRLVFVSDRGRQVRCTPAGSDLAREYRSRNGGQTPHQ